MRSEEADGVADRRRILRRGAILGLALLTVGAVPGPAERRPEAPDALTARGRACMEARGFDAATLVFVADLDGRVGYASTATSDLRDLDAVVPRLDAGRGGAYDALRSCIEELKEEAARIVPAKTDLDPDLEADVRACVAAAPHAEVVDSLEVLGWEDGRLAVEYVHPDLGPRALDELTAAVADCLPPARP